jgi:hypothetical protein
MVPCVRLVVRGTEDVGGVADVLDGQLVVDLFLRFVLPGQAAQLRVVVVAAANRLLEDGWVRGEAAQIVVIDQPPELAARDQPALHLVVPDALPDFRQFRQWIRHR